MLKRNILAHRGIWSHKAEQNSLSSIKRALDCGFGLETDVRDQSGTLVISHDPPEKQALRLDKILEVIRLSSGNGRIAVNIKADGLHRMLKLACEQYALSSEKFYVFDMSVPDTINYISNGFPVYTRISDYEDQPALLESTVGVWVDNFSGSFPQVARAKRIIDAGRRACIVSGELHRRDHFMLWDSIKSSGIHLSPLMELCTDHPNEAYSHLGTE